jgi:hypothetical protein
LQNRNCLALQGLESNTPLRQAGLEQVRRVGCSAPLESATIGQVVTKRRMFDPYNKCGHL